MREIDCTDCSPVVGEFVSAAEKACSFLDLCTPGMTEIVALTLAATEVLSRLAGSMEDAARDAQRRRPTVRS